MLCWKHGFQGEKMCICDEWQQGDFKHDEVTLIPENYESNEDENIEEVQVVHDVGGLNNIINLICLKEFSIISLYWTK